MEKNFMGKQLWIPTVGGKQLDAMFFSGNNNYQEEQADCACQRCDFRASPTMIMNNPNAMFYQ